MLSTAPLAASPVAPWSPTSCQPTLNVTLDACLVPSHDGSLRVDTSHVCVLDTFLDASACESILRGSGREALRLRTSCGSGPPVTRLTLSGPSGCVTA